MGSTDTAVAFAKQKAEDILSFFGLNVEVDAGINEDVIELNVPTSTMNGFLIGQKGENMRSIQHIISLLLKSAGHDVSRVNLDVADYKKQRADRLAEQVKQWAEHVKSSGQPMDLQPMNAADRRTVHRTIGEIEGVTSESSGEGRDRRVVLRPS